MAIVLLAHLQLEPDPALPLMQFGTLGGVLLGGDFIRQAQVEQRRQLGFDLLLLAEQLLAVLGVLLGAGFRLGPDDLHDPAASGLVESHAAKHADELVLDLLLGHPIPRMPFGAIVGAEVIGIFARLPARGRLSLGLAGDEMTTMAAADEAAREGELVGTAHALRKLVLDSLERGPVHQWLEGAGIPLTLVAHLSDDVAVEQQLVEREPREDGPALGVDDALPLQFQTQRFDGERLIGVKLEHPLDLRRFDRIVFHRAAAVDSHAAESVRPPQRQAILDSSLQT